MRPEMAQQQPTHSRPPRHPGDFGRCRRQGGHRGMRPIAVQTVAPVQEKIRVPSQAFKPVAETRVTRMDEAPLPRLHPKRHAVEDGLGMRNLAAKDAQATTVQ